MQDEGEHIGTNAVRGGSTPHIVRYVLGISIVLAIVGMAVVLAI